MHVGPPRPPGEGRAGDRPPGTGLVGLSYQLSGLARLRATTLSSMRAVLATSWRELSMMGSPEPYQCGHTAVDVGDLLVGQASVA